MIQWLVRWRGNGMWLILLLLLLLSLRFWFLGELGAGGRAVTSLPDKSNLFECQLIWVVFVCFLFGHFWSMAKSWLYNVILCVHIVHHPPPLYLSLYLSIFLSGIALLLFLKLLLYSTVFMLCFLSHFSVTNIYILLLPHCVCQSLLMWIILAFCIFVIALLSSNLWAAAPHSCSAELTVG